MNFVQVGPDPMQLMCPSCRAQIVTSTKSKATTKTHVIAILLCIFGCWPCVILPYCMDTCRSTDHHCPSCNAYLGTYDR